MVAPVAAAAAPSMLSTLGPSLIGAAGSIAGGLLSGGDDARDINNRNIKIQKQFAKNQIQWKVNDAKAAGLHPLFALGSSTNFSPANVMPGQSNMGSAVADAASHIARGVEKTSAQPLASAQLRSINASANRDEAQAALANSEARRIEQTINNQQDTAGPAVNAITAPVGKVQVQPSKVISRSKSDSSRTAGDTPAWRKAEVLPGMFVDVPWSDEGIFEGMEGILPGAATLLRNLWNMSAEQRKWLSKQPKMHKRMKNLQQYMRTLKRNPTKGGF